jgi:hypothetical protein
VLTKLEVTIPIRIGFEDLWDENYHSIHFAFLIVDYIGDLFFLLDMLVNFRTSYMDHGVIHTDTRKVQLHFKSSIEHSSLKIFN